MNRLLNTSSMIGSARVPIAARSGSASMRPSRRWSRALSSAPQPGSTTTVVVASTMIAGPATRSPGRRWARSNTGVSNVSAGWCGARAVIIVTRSAGSSGSLAVRGTIASSGSSISAMRPIASTATCTTTRPRPSTTNP